MHPDCHKLIDYLNSKINMLECILKNKQVFKDELSKKYKKNNLIGDLLKEITAAESMIKNHLEIESLQEAIHHIKISEFCNEEKED